MSPGLSDLPLALRTRIVAAVSTLSPSPPVFPILSDAYKLYQYLPNDLLPLAESSPTLSTAIADILGPRTLYLTRQVTGRNLHRWIAALAPFVKAVSFWDTRTLYSIGNANENYLADIQPHCVLEDVVKALGEVDGERVKLQSLDVTDVPFDHLGEEKELEDALKLALRRSHKCLKQLGLAVHENCERALKEVHLECLDVLKIEASGDNYVDGISAGTWTGVDFWDIVKALGGTIRELRFKRVMRPPCTSVEESGLEMEFFEGVRELRVQQLNLGLPVDHAGMAKFISLFKNLDCLYWNGDITPHNVETILLGCRNLTQLHFAQCFIRYVEHPSTEYEDEQDVKALWEGLAMTQSRLRTLELKAALSEEIMCALEGSIELEVFGSEIGVHSVANLVPLLARSRKIRELNLSFPDSFSVEQTDSLKEDGWGTFVEAIDGASNTLQVLRIRNGNASHPVEPDVDAAVDAIVRTLRKMSESARVVMFEVPLQTSEHRVMFDALTMVMEAAEECPNLEVLHLRLGAARVEYVWDSEEECADKCVALLAAKRRLEEKAPRLHQLYLEGYDEIAEEQVEP